MDDCIFCNIIQKKQPADMVFENEDFIVFKDIHPKAPVHLLLTPKMHITSVNELKPKDAELAGKLLLLAKDIAQKAGIGSGYKLLFNVGREGGQLIDHLHLHLLGGWGKSSNSFPV